LEGLQRVLLDGKSTRAFTAADGELLEEDLTILLRCVLDPFWDALEMANLALAHMYSMEGSALQAACSSVNFAQLLIEIWYMSKLELVTLCDSPTTLCGVGWKEACFRTGCVIIIFDRSD
jgi:hypothetical protein